VNVIETTIPGVLILEPVVCGDPRGFFVETYRHAWHEQTGLPPWFAQDNQSRSTRGVLRGLHYQRIQMQGKLLRVSRGRVFDVGVDLRYGSPTFGKWLGLILDDVSHRQLWLPPGFAHGFVVLSDDADFVYRCTDYYHPESEAGVAWDDPDLAIEWPEEIRKAVRLSDKDAKLPRLRDLPQDRLPAYCDLGEWQ
jgi:dTDP-4-dehydrorhamnose 3,5-epimerase